MSSRVPLALLILLVVGCKTDIAAMEVDRVPDDRDTGAASQEAGGAAPREGGAWTAADSGGSSSAGGGEGAPADGSAGALGGDRATDGGAADVALHFAIDSGITDPGTDGDGDFVIGPKYQNAAELTVSSAVPRGTVFQFSMSSKDSTIYPGRSDLTPPGDFVRKVWAYVPKQYVDGTEAPFLVAMDGASYASDLPKVLDNLISEKKLPVLIAVMIDPGPGDGQGSQRGLEYDTISDVFVDFIEKEALPAVRANPALQKAYPNLTFTSDPEGRGALGCSSGGAAAFTMGWFRPDLYRRIVTYSGTFVNQDPKNPVYPHGAWTYHEKLIVMTDAKPLRVFLQVGTNDNNLDSDPRFNNDMMHNWITANKAMAAALKAKAYHYRFLLADGATHCDSRVRLQTLPETLLWTWRGYPIN